MFLPIRLIPIKFCHKIKFCHHSDDDNSGLQPGVSIIQLTSIMISIDNLSAEGDVSI